MVDGQTIKTCRDITSIKESICNPNFAECYRGYLVNMYHIKKISKSDKIITLSSDKVIPMNKTKFQEVFLTYMYMHTGIRLSNKYPK